MTQTPVQWSSSEAEADLSGRRLGDYQLLRRLGRGGMAEVYLAEQTSLRRPVAFKVLRSTLARDDAYVRRFHHEAQAAAKLVHANIVQIHEVGCVDGTHYIAQEYVPGQNLKQLLARRGKGLDAAPAVSVLRQVAAALQKAAEQNIIHRDIKPENILLNNSGDVKVADFGLARVIREGEVLDLTQVGITMGTPLYMSPEQVEGQQTDPRSDLYSLGVTSYHMLAGRPPFEGETALAIAVQHLKSEPVRLEALRPDLPEGLCRIVHKLLAKNRKDRYPNAIELLKDLRALRIEGLEETWSELMIPVGEHPVETPGLMAATQHLGRVMHSADRDRRKKWLVPLMIVGMLVAFPLGGLVAWSNRPRPLLAFSPSELPKVKKFDSVAEQYYYAKMATTNVEQAWRAVWEYFPPEENGVRVPTNVYYGRLAKRGLAIHYLQENDPSKYPEALALFNELAKADDEDKIHLEGVAGEALVYDRLNEPDEVRERLPQLMPQNRRRLLDHWYLKQGIDRLAAKYGVEGAE